MAITKCSSCGRRVSSQWPECPACGAKTGKRESKSGGLRRFNPTPHYLIGTTLATVGALAYGSQLFRNVVDERVVAGGLVFIALGACWYAAARLLAVLR
jgi:hypothetical protein